MTQGHLCEDCGLLLFDPSDGCPTCDRSAGVGTADWVRYHERPESDERPGASNYRPTEWVIAHHCAEEFLALTLQSELQRHGVVSWLRSLELPGYQGLTFSRMEWGWLLVDREDAEHAQAIIAEFLETFDDARGGVEYEEK